MRWECAAAPAAAHSGRRYGALSVRTVGRRVCAGDRRERHRVLDRLGVHVYEVAGDLQVVGRGRLHHARRRDVLGPHQGGLTVLW
jgi:hypothetical protein